MKGPGRTIKAADSQLDHVGWWPKGALQHRAGRLYGLDLPHATTTNHPAIDLVFDGDVNSVEVGSELIVRLG